MRKSEKNKILQQFAFKSDEQVEKEYYDSVYNSLGSQTEQLYDLGYDMRDILEREKYEKYKIEYSNILEEICIKRNIKLWENR